MLGGATAVQSRGMEHWHPNPAFFFQSGGGPVLDMGPYYITQLINLLGPVKKVTAVASRGYAERVVENGPRAGERIPVDVSTTVNGVVEFVAGANVSMAFSWDVKAHHRIPFELYGAEGTLRGS